ADDIDLDVSPCMPAQALRPAHPLLSIDQDGTLELHADLDMAAALGLATAGAGLPLLVEISGQITELGRLLLRFGPPRPDEAALFVFGGKGPPGAPGPPLLVEVDHRVAERLTFLVRGEDRVLAAVVERTDAPSFAVLSRGS